MTVAVALTCLLIVVARVTDITLDTVRTVAIVQGRRLFASLLGFFEALIYIVVVAQVLRNFDHYWYAAAYATGFALGTYLGITVEGVLAFGDQIVSLFTRLGGEVAASLRAKGFGVTETMGRGRDGEVAVLYVEAPRKQIPQLIQVARMADPVCFYVVNDVRMAARASQQAQNAHRMAA